MVFTVQPGFCMIEGEKLLVHAVQPTLVKWESVTMMTKKKKTKKQHSAVY